MAYYANRVTLYDVKSIKPKMIYYSMRTCWWTHDKYHLCQHPSGLPCDPRGGMLMQTDDVEGWFEAAEKNPDFYGKYKLEAFMAAHHLNCVVGKDDSRSTCLETWEEYEEMLNEYYTDN